jgi:predicted Ser/Thr protein kinase
MNQPPDSVFKPGQILVGKYKIERVLGRGGMGVVLAARHLQLEERVAIKLMLGDAIRNTEAVTRFVQEARAAARLESAHVAKVSDVGTLDDGQPYMVMEYLDGQDLSQVLEATGPLPIQDAVDYVLQAAEALAEAHSIGIIHRDLKPSNLFLTRRRDRAVHVKVLDFGISKMVNTSASRSDNGITRTSTMMGSPLYMSPEQMMSVKDVDARSDIWALGVILFELITGSPPFIADALPQVCALVLQSPDPLASSRRAGVSPELDAIIHRCLAKSPADRFRSVAELAIALRGTAGKTGLASIERILLLATGNADQAGWLEGPVTSTLAETPAPAFLPGTQAAWGETSSALPRRRRTWLVPLLGVPLLGAAAFWFAQRQPNDAPAGALQSPTSAATTPVAEAPQAPTPKLDVAVPAAAVVAPLPLPGDDAAALPSPRSAAAGETAPTPLASSTPPKKGRSSSSKALAGQTAKSSTASAPVRVAPRPVAAEEPPDLGGRL